MNPTYLALLTALLLLTACNQAPSESPAASSSDETAPHREPNPDGDSSGESGASESAPTDEETEAPGFAIEEWGLLRVRGDEAELATSGIATGARANSIQQLLEAPLAKPVIYVLPDESTSEDPFSVRLSLQYADSRRHELWPPPTETGTDTVVWDARVEGMCDGSADAEAVAEHCGQFVAPAYCEAAEIASYVTQPRPCLHVGDRESPVLLYNGSVPEALMEPVTRTDAGWVVRDHPVAHLWWFDGDTLRYAEGLEPLQVVATGAAALPGSEVPTSQNVGALIETELEQMGLTTAPDFIAAWRPDLLSDALPWQVFGIYATPVVQEALPLTITPSPQRTTRVLAFVVESTGFTDEEASLPDDLLPSELREQAVLGALIQDGEATLGTDGTLFGDPGDSNDMSAVLGQIGNLEGDLNGVGGLGMRGEGVSGGEIVGGSSGPSGLGSLGDPAPSSVSLSVANPEVEGALDPSVLRRIARQHQREVRDCYERYIPQNPTMAGVVRVNATIDSTGSVANASIASSSLGMPGVESCIMNRLRHWRFPEPDDGSVVNVSFPFDFAPGG